MNLDEFGVYKLMISIVTAISIEKPRFDARFSPRSILAQSPPFRISSGSVKIQAISQFLVVKIHDLTIIHDLISTILEHHPLAFPKKSPKPQRISRSGRSRPHRASGARRGDRSFHSSDLIEMRRKKFGITNRNGDIKWENLFWMSWTKTKQTPDGKVPTLWWRTWPAHLWVALSEWSIKVRGVGWSQAKWPKSARLKV